MQCRPRSQVLANGAQGKDLRSGARTLEFASQMRGEIGQPGGILALRSDDLCLLDARRPGTVLRHCVAMVAGREQRGLGKTMLAG